MLSVFYILLIQFYRGRFPPKTRKRSSWQRLKKSKKFSENTKIGTSVVKIATTANKIFNLRIQFIMKKILTILGLLMFVWGCNSQVPIKQSEETIEQQEDLANCPQPSEVLPEIKISQKGIFYEAFNYQIQDIIADRDTIEFQSPNGNFIFCRENNTWTVKSATKSLQTENSKEYYQQLANPPYQNIEINGKIYQYRAILEPNPFPNFKQEARQVKFELLKPGNSEPQVTVLYTVEQIQQANTGASLGVPKVTLGVRQSTGALYYGDNQISSAKVDRILWSVSSELGEGNGGIATIISYDLATEAINLIQPEEIQGQQINDLAIANDTLWIATQMAGEGNPYIPSMGLVAYNLNSKTIRSYRVDNSPIVGAIPTKLKLEEDLLWVGTGNGICQVNWQTADNEDSWSCWRFALMAKLPAEGLPIYNSSLQNNPITTITSNDIEVLWWTPTSLEPRQGRYEIKYQPGFTVKLDKVGFISWEELYPPDVNVDKWIRSWQPPVYWPGKDWHWQGSRFVRGFDEVGLNLVGLGPNGIGIEKFDRNLLQNKNAIRGDLEIIELTKDSTEVKYYSAWVDDNNLQPLLTIVPQEKPQLIQPNPLDRLAGK